MIHAPFTLRGRNPDVLTCIANLSNDEVFTPPEFANRMLDTLTEAWSASHDGANLWADKTVRFLDPCTKSGVFLREITSRLTKGLADEIPDLDERVNHILTKQVFGIGITALTSLLARRARSMPMGSTPLRRHLPAKRETSGSSVQNTLGPTANAYFAVPAKAHWIAANVWKPTAQHSTAQHSSSICCRYLKASALIDLLAPENRLDLKQSSKARRKNRPAMFWSIKTAERDTPQEVPSHRAQT